jgi:hypothetical protein
MSQTGCEQHAQSRMGLPLVEGHPLRKSGIFLALLPVVMILSMCSLAQSVDAQGSFLAQGAGSTVAPSQELQPSPAPSSDCTLRVPSKVPNEVTQESVGEEVNAPSAYMPLSARCKFDLFLRQTYSPYTFASVIYEATWAQMMAQWPQYGGGMQGWGKRLGATLADTESRRFIQGFLYSTAFHEDPRYFPSGKKRLIGRAWYAATRVLVTRNDLGQSELNRAELLGTLSTSSLQNAYYPRQYRTLSNTMSRFEGALSSDATSHLLQEFTPDLKRLFHKHCPRKIQEFEARVPIPADYRW